jgi:hypothetical protein
MNSTRITHWKHLIPLLPAVFAAAALTGCGHGDAIIFASNKQIGVKVGVDSQKIPEVSIGYNGQDFALVPVYKKDPKTATATPPNSADPSKGAPSEHGKTRDISEVGKYLATSGINDQDAYSVYGSFVGKAQGKGDIEGAKADLSLSQFFATGIAAQILAKDAGAAMVNPKAKAPAEATAETAVARELVEMNRELEDVMKHVTDSTKNVDKAKLDKLLKDDQGAYLGGTEAWPDEYGGKPAADLRRKLVFDGNMYVKTLALRARNSK